MRCLNVFLAKTSMRRIGRHGPRTLPRDHPLLDLDNLVVVPHPGSATVQTRDAMARRSVET